jgi:hypothetical protein
MKVFLFFKARCTGRYQCIQLFGYRSRTLGSIANAKTRDWLYRHRRAPVIQLLLAGLHRTHGVELFTHT